MLPHILEKSAEPSKVIGWTATTQDELARRAIVMSIVSTFGREGYATRYKAPGPWSLRK
jgi:hypothetical protein